MYKNGKIRHVETIPGMWGGGNEFNYDILQELL
jgi:hypothetical protein